MGECSAAMSFTGAVRGVSFADTDYLILASDVKFLRTLFLLVCARSTRPRASPGLRIVVARGSPPQNAPRSGCSVGGRRRTLCVPRLSAGTVCPRWPVLLLRLARAHARGVERGLEAGPQRNRACSGGWCGGCCCAARTLRCTQDQGLSRVRATSSASCPRARPPGQQRPCGSTGCQRCLVRTVSVRTPSESVPGVSACVEG